MNTLNIFLSYSYVSALINLSWNDLLFAVEQGFMSPDAAVEHAIVKLGDKNSEQSVLDLACLEKGESIHPYIDKLASKVSEEDKEETQKKFLYVLLNWIYEHIDNYSDPLEAVEIVYADFNYPEIISNFIRYMPSDQPTLGSLEENIKQLYINWRNYLDFQRTKYLV